ncbi:MAG: type II toxin-antitoxin system RelE/ParE family toxin [bacterium]|nr:type II toxin-antitoxin system RelE/ParE family toxin [bacterium]MDA1292178.1 type II toxin-antitoxin system RelE/ParE family toxin [bacterium]
MDRITKFLRKLHGKEKDVWDALLSQLHKDYREIPGLKKLQGAANRYRIRMGRYRIIFEVRKGNDVQIRRITKRDEGTYKNL